MRKDDVRNQVLNLFYKYAPNALKEDHLLRDEELKYSEDEILEALTLLVEEGLVHKAPNKNCLGEGSFRYNLNDYGNRPIEKFISYEDIKLLRFIDGEVATAEPLNQAIIGLCKISEELEKKLKDDYDRQIHSFWANQITLFSIFISIFSFIIIGFGKSINSPGATISERLLQNSIDLIPLAVILILFVLTLHFLFNKKATKK